MIVAIGHSTQENPVTGVTGIRWEEQLTEPVAEEAGRLLKLLGYDARTDAPHTNATAVKNWANGLGAALLVDIHTDAAGSAGNTTVRGTSAFWNTRGGNSTKGEKLARCLYERVGAVGGVRRAIGGRSDLVVLYGTSMPAALVELEFHDRSDTAQLVKARWLEYGAAVARAILDYLGDYRAFTTTTPLPKEDAVTKDQADRIIELLEAIARQTLTVSDALTPGEDGIKYDGHVYAQLRALVDKPAAGGGDPAQVAASVAPLLEVVPRPV